MATITKQTIYLDLTPGRVFPVLHVSQGDTGLEALEFKLVQNGMVFNIPAAVTDIQLNGTTPLGVFSYNDPTWSGNTVTANVTETMTAEKGMVICELRLLDSTLNSIGTLNFIISVEPSPYTNAHVSTSDMATIMAALNGSQQNMLLSKSWAVGDTGVRSGENTNNSKWWSSISQSWAVGGTGDRSGEDTNNSKYYADQSRIEGNGLASVFSDVLDYSAGDYVIHDGILYEFTVDHSAGAWNLSDVHAVNIGDELNSLPAKMNGGQIAISRTAILFDFAEDTDYKLIQGVACDGAYFYVFKSATSGGASALIKYDVSTYAVVKSIIVNHAHIGDATVYGSRLYYTDNSSVYSMDLSLTGAETTVASVAMHTIEYYDGYFYSVNANTLYKYDTSFSLVSTVSLPVPAGGIPGAQQGISIHEGLIFSCRYFPSAVFVYDLNGNPVAYYSLGHINGVYMVGELEDLVWVGDTAIAVTSQYTGQFSDDRAQQFFALDFRKGVVNRADAVGAGYKRVYVNPTATRFDSDGSSGAPYASATWAVRESCAIYGKVNQVLVYVTPGTVLKDGLLSVNGVSNVVVQSTGAKVKTHGIAIQGASNVTVSAFSAIHDSDGTYANNAMVSVVYSDAILHDIDIDCANSSMIPLFVNQSTLNAHGGTTSNYGADIKNSFNNSEIILSRDGDPDGAITGKGAGPYISTMTSKFIKSEDRQYVYNRIGQHTGFFGFEISLAQHPLPENGTFTFDFQSLVPYEFKTLIPCGITVNPYGVPSSAASKLGNPYFNTKYEFSVTSEASASEGTLEVGVFYQYDVTA